MNETVINIIISKSFSLANFVNHNCLTLSGATHAEKSVVPQPVNVPGLDSV